MTKEEQILIKIKKLQETRDYAAPEERDRLTKTIERLFEQLSEVAPEVTITLSTSAAEILARLQKRQPILTDAETVAAALNVYEMHLKAVAE